MRAYTDLTSQPSKEIYSLDDLEIALMPFINRGKLLRNVTSSFGIDADLVSPSREKERKRDVSRERLLRFF